MRYVLTRSRRFITLVERAGDAIITNHVWRVGTAHQNVACFDAVASKAIVTEDVIGRIYTHASLIVACIVGTRNAVVTIHGHAVNAIRAIACFIAIAGIPVVALRIHRARCSSDAAERFAAVFRYVAKCRVWRGRARTA